MSKLQEIVDEVQAVANQTQNPARRYERMTGFSTDGFNVHGEGNVLEITCYPEIMFDGAEPPVPTDDNEGFLFSTANGVQRAWAVPIKVKDDGKPGARSKNLRAYDWDTVANEDGTLEEVRLGKTDGFWHEGVKDGEGNVVPPDHLVKFAGSSRRHSLRRYGDEFFAVEHDWVDVELDFKPGAAPRLVLRDDLDIQA